VPSDRLSPVTLTGQVTVHRSEDGRARVHATDEWQRPSKRLR
jgi:hypothetical protein